MKKGKLIKKSIGLDLDEVIASIIPGVLNIINQENNSDYTINDILDYNLSCIGVKDPVRFFKSHLEIFTNAKPFERSKEIISLLKQRGYKIHIITARSEPLITREWLKEQNIPYDSLITHCDGRKGVIARELNLDCYVDDNPYYLEHVTEESPQTRVYLFDRPWNKYYAHFPRVRDWYELYKKINS